MQKLPCGCSSGARECPAKTNITPKGSIGVHFTFEEKKVSIEPFELGDSELVEEDSVPAFCVLPANRNKIQSRRADSNR